MKPMLAAKIKKETLDADLARLDFPAYVQPKLDGIRALVTRHGPLSRKLEPLPNAGVNALLDPRKQPWLLGMDGELIDGSPSDDPYRRSHKVVANEDFPLGDLRLWVYDSWHCGGTYADRFRMLSRAIGRGKLADRVVLVPTQTVRSLAELLDVESSFVEAGYEGLVYRGTAAPYKFGRSTVREGYLVALKRFEESEAEILGCLAQKTNTNEAKLDKVGATKRSSHKAGKVEVDTLGVMVARDTKTGVEFELMRGKMTREEAKEAWEAWKRDPDAFRRGAVAKYKHFPHGVKEKPRHATWTGWRSRWDLS